jgi:hypothetical protein
MNIKTAALATLAAAALVVTGALGAASYASAQEPTPPAGQQQAAPHQRAEDFLGKVAGKLNVTLDQLKQAFRDAALDTVDEAIASGQLTAEQGANIKDRINSGQTLGIGRFLREHRAERMRAERLAKVRRGIVNSAADAIGIPAADLRTELKGGASLADVAGEHNVILDDDKAHVTADAQAKLDQLVAGGKLKQERADAALQKFTDSLDMLLNKTRSAQ